MGNSSKHPASTCRCDRLAVLRSWYEVCWIAVDDVPPGYCAMLEILVMAGTSNKITSDKPRAVQRSQPTKWLIGNSRCITESYSWHLSTIPKRRQPGRRHIRLATAQTLLARTAS